MHEVIEVTKPHAHRNPAQPVAKARTNVATVEAAVTNDAGYMDLVAQFYSTWEYGLDVLQRSILFWDTMRQRGNNMLEHERVGLPPVLDFKYETILDARQFETPANYALLRIVELGEDCWDDCVDPEKPPVVVFDPRAGHGPGIGGFKRDSEVGMALHEGHPVYFVVFFPEPVLGQTLGNVHLALRRFVEEVQQRHDGKQPVLYGNCQAGWAVTLLAADCEGLAGPTVLNGSPLSYWAGESGVNPMRIAGGLTGGTWLAHYLADLGNGRFDGAWLAQNFENLKPEKAIWEKYAGLFSNVDTERGRFLRFERWWNGFYFLSREEIVAIVENLFIGNQLESGEFRIDDTCCADLRRIRNPVVIFASYGDNITPPHQALAWIPAVYKDTEDLKQAGQRIVYMTNPHVGHLGIFVSAKVALSEHRAILESLPKIEALEPGLYEMSVDKLPKAKPRSSPDYQTRFEERFVEDIRFEYPRQAFEQVREFSELWETLYSGFVSPWVRAVSNPISAEIVKWTHPMRASRYMLSDAFNPWMRVMESLADAVQSNRTPLPSTHLHIEWEREMTSRVSKSIENARSVRDSWYEQAFALLYPDANSLSMFECSPSDDHACES